MSVERDQLRINEAVRSQQVHLIDENGVSRGVVDRSEALAIARSVGVDLIEVAPSATPPVCRVMSYSKWCYQQERQRRKTRQQAQETKEVRFGLSIGREDLRTKCRHAVQWLGAGHKVRFVVQIKGREATRLELVDQLLDKIRNELGDAGVDSGDVHREPRRVWFVRQP